MGPASPGEDFYVALCEALQAVPYDVKTRAAGYLGDAIWPWSTMRPDERALYEAAAARFLSE